MAIAHDALSENSTTDSVSFTANASWTHTPVGTPKGVVVIITQPLSSADEVSSVTYGGVTLARVISTARTVTEQMRVYIYHLGSNIPTGAQTVAITLTTQTASAKHGFAFTATAGTDRDTVADSSNGVDLGIIANPSITVTHTATLSGWAGYAAHGYGANSVVTTGLQTGETYQAGHDPGAAVAMTYTRHSGADAASSTYGYTTLASDDQLIAAVVLREIAAVNLTPATATLSGVTLDPVPQPVTVNLTPVTATLTGVVLSPEPPASTVDLTPATAVLSAVALDPVPQPVTVNLTPALASLVGITLTPIPQPVTVNLTPAAVTFEGVVLNPVPQTVTVNLTPVLAALIGVALDPVPGSAPSSVDLTPAAVSLTGIALNPVPQPVTINLVSATVTATGVALNPVPQPVTVNLSVALFTLTAVPLTFGEMPPRFTRIVSVPNPIPVDVETEPSYATSFTSYLTEVIV